MLNAIIWTKEGDDKICESMKHPYRDRVNWRLAGSYQRVTELLVSDEQFHLLITILCPSDIEALYQIKLCQEQNPSLSMIAIFDTDDVSAIDQALTLILGRFSVSDQQESSVEIREPVHNERDPSTQMSTLRTHVYEEKLNNCHLTPRQLEVLELIMVGKSNKEIARDLMLSEGTVKVHCMALYKEMSVSNRTQAALMAETIFRTG